MKRSIVLTGMVLAFAACGGAGDEVGSSGDSAVIESSDGMASLTLSPASLPEDVSIDDIHLDWIAGSSDEPGAPLAAVQLSPSGLSLSESATLRIDVPADTEELLVVHNDARGFEFVEVDFESTADRLVATIEIEHFSVLTLHGPDMFIVTAAAEPLKLTVGEEQFVTVEFEVWNPFVSIWILVVDGNTVGYQRFDFRLESMVPLFPPQVVWFTRGSNGMGAESGRWFPSSVDAAVSRDALSLAMSASSRCTFPNSDYVSSTAAMTLNLRLIDTGPVATGPFSEFIEVFEEQLRSIPEDVEDEQGNRIPFTLEIGESIQAQEAVHRHWDVECVAADVEAPTTTTTTTSAEDPPEDLDVIAGSSQFFDCPPDFQLDVIGRLLSGKEGETSEHLAETPVAPGSNVVCTKKTTLNPDVFTMMVEGDGETLSTAENTSYQVRFVVNNEWPVNEYYDDTGFEVLVQWNRLAKQWVGVVRDQQGTRVSNDADVTIEWLDSSTLQVAVDVPGLDVEVTEMRTELNVVVTDDNDAIQFTNFDVAIWQKES